MVENEGADAVIGGGLESITMLQNDFNKNNLFNPWLMDHYKQIYMPMGLTAEVVAERYKVTREAQDEYALASQQRTAAFQKAGKDKDEIVADDGHDGGHRQGDRRRSRRSRSRSTATSATVPRPRSKASQKLPGAFKEAGSVTAGNSSQFSDGASATLIMSAESAKALGIKPLGFFRGCVFAGCEPDEMGIGPVFAVPKLLKRAGLTIDDIDIVELNEAFASQVVYCRDRLGISMEQAQPERRLDLDRPPLRHDRLAHDRHAAPRAAAPEEALGHRHHVHRRRHGRRGAVRSRASNRIDGHGATGW